MVLALKEEPREAACTQQPFCVLHRGVLVAETVLWQMRVYKTSVQVISLWLGYLGRLVGLLLGLTARAGCAAVACWHAAA